MLNHHLFGLCVLVSCMILARSLTRSALSLCDRPDGFCDIKVLHRKTNNTYELLVPNYHLNSTKKLAFCLRSRSVSRATNNECNLQNLASNYQCFYVQYNEDNSLKSFSKYGASPTFTPLSSTPSNTATYTLTTISLIVHLNTLTPKDNIYELVMGNSKDLSTDLSSKTAFFHTFNRDPNTTITGNILMQRYHTCFYFYYNNFYQFNIIFYGAVVRNGQEMLYLGVLAYLSENDNNTPYTNVSLNMWGCYSFSKSHASRDMIGFSTSSAVLTDMFSLYYDAPFRDNVANILGQNNIEMVSTTYQTNRSLSYYYYAISGYRKFNTLDQKGDERIIEKMGQQYCYAVGYAFDNQPIYPYQSNQKHPYFACWSPILTISDSHLRLHILISLALLYLLFQ